MWSALSLDQTHSIYIVDPILTKTVYIIIKNLYFFYVCYQIIHFISKVCSNKKVHFHFKIALSPISHLYSLAFIKLIVLKPAGNVLFKLCLSIFTYNESFTLLNTRNEFGLSRPSNGDSINFVILLAYARIRLQEKYFLFS